MKTVHRLIFYWLTQNKMSKKELIKNKIYLPHQGTKQKQLNARLGSLLIL